MSSFHQDLDNMTRDMHSRSLQVEYMSKTPLLNLILEQKNLKFNGGKWYMETVDTDTTEDLAQDYVVGQQLTHGTTEVTDEYKFRRKYFQHPVVIDFEQDLENAYQTEDRTQLHNLAKFMVRKAQEGTRLHLRKLIFGAATDTAAQVQGLDSALTVDATYGNLARTNSTGVRDWWQPGDNRWTASTQATERTISINALREWADPLTDLESEGGKFVWVIGNTLWLQIVAEAEARNIGRKIDPNGMAKFNIQEVEIDGMRIIKEPFLQSKYNTQMGQTTGAAGGLERRVYGLNTQDWQLMIHPKRNFYMLPFFDQAQIANGIDFKMARIQFAGNLFCTHPNRSIYFSNVVP